MKRRVKIYFLEQLSTDETELREWFKELVEVDLKLGMGGDFREIIPCIPFRVS